jgi:hypothetical protein
VAGTGGMLQNAPTIGMILVGLGLSGRMALHVGNGDQWADAMRQTQAHTGSGQVDLKWCARQVRQAVANGWRLGGLSGRGVAENHGTHVRST